MEFESIKTAVNEILAKSDCASTYSDLKFISSGKHGIAFLADNLYVIKIMPAHDGQMKNENYLNMFKEDCIREVSTMRAFSACNVGVHCISACSVTTAFTFYNIIVMEKLDGTLYDLLTTPYPSIDESIVEYQLINILDVMKNNSLQHYDMTLMNIGYKKNEEGYQFLLIDFGNGDIGQHNIEYEVQVISESIRELKGTLPTWAKELVEALQKGLVEYVKALYPEKQLERKAMHDAFAEYKRLQQNRKTSFVVS
jgi:tRNA A-37 threonylcarbamoyl transferase component Bud32